MDMLGLIAAFGGGILGACIGALPSFILAGIVAIAGGVATLAGAADLSVGNVAFGSILGPHIAFAGGVAAAAYAANKKNILPSGGADILASLNGLGDSGVLLVGGIFGVFGYVVNHLYAVVLGLKTDTVAMTVFTLAIVTRLALGNTGIIGKYTGEGKRQYISTGQGMVYNIVMGGGIGIAVSFVAASMLNAGVDPALLGIFPALCFGISATSLIFTQTGFATPATHHITLPAASAAVMAANPFMGVVFGILGAILGDFAGRTFNSHCDSHIDPPATAIFICIFIINALF